MKIFFQSEKFDSHALLKKFSDNNKKSGSIISFTGQVRPMRNKKKITSIDIELYKKMAYVQKLYNSVYMHMRCCSEDLRYVTLKMLGNASKKFTLEKIFDFFRTRIFFDFF